MANSLILKERLGQIIAEIGVTERQVTVLIEFAFKRRRVGLSTVLDRCQPHVIQTTDL